VVPLIAGETVIVDFNPQASLPKSSGRAVSEDVEAQ